jgi:hypothetical protein
MAKEQSVARKQSRSKRDKQQEAGPGTEQNGREDEVARYEKELAGYLQERIKPGLNRGAIPLLARSIAKEIAHREPPDGAPVDAEVDDERSAEGDEPSAATDDESGAETDDEAGAETGDESGAETDDEASAETDDEAGAETDDEASADADYEQDAEADDESSAEGEATSDFEADMRELQAELGEDWILRFSVQGDDAWLTAEKDDGSQRVEAPTASVLAEAVELLNEGGGRST